MRAVVLTLALPIALNCGAPASLPPPATPVVTSGLARPIPLVVDVDALGPCLVDAVVWAMGYWRYKLDADLLVPMPLAVYHGDFSGAILVTADGAPVIGGERFLADVDAGKTASRLSDDGRSIDAALVILRREQCYVAGLVAAHELGHALGLGHSDTPGSLMSPALEDGLLLDADELSRVRENRPSLPVAQ